MSESQLAITGPKASDQLASFLGIEKGMMLETLKAQCFPGKRPDEVSDTQLAAFVSTANVLQVNPLIPGMLYAYPSKNGGVVPILGPDGTFKKLDEHIANGKLEGFECVVFPEDVTQKPTHATATIYRKNAKPATYTALFSEWAVSGSPVWGSKPRHMLWTRAIKQAARQVIHGLPMDAEEFAMAEMQNVTPASVAPARPEPPKRSAKGAAAVKSNPEVVVEQETAPVTPEPTPAPAPEASKAETPAASAPEPVTPAPAASEPAPTPAPAPEPAKARRAAVKPVVQRSSLTDKEVVTVTASVTEFKTLPITKGGASHQSITAMVSGPEFAGLVYHLGGAAAPEWQLEKPVRLTIRGEFSPKMNKVVSWVDKIELPEAKTESPDSTMDV